LDHVEFKNRKRNGPSPSGLRSIYATSAELSETGYESFPYFNSSNYRCSGKY
jgi:hypothetical protein